MQKLLFVFCLLFALPLHAEDTGEPDLLAPEAVVAEPEEDKNNEISVSLPECNDQDLLRQVDILVGEYNEKHPVLSLLDRRRRIMRLRSMSEYGEESVSAFNSGENRVIADKLLMTKINQGLSDFQIRLCKSKVRGREFKPVYLMMYRDKDGRIHVYVLNYLENPSEDLSLVL